jgi:succinate dehydrogenase iron-sulfur subunit
MRIQLKIWRQENRANPGQLVTYDLTEVNPDMSFLEMLDTLNERLVRQRERPVEFDHDCREGICGQCGVMIKGRAHGPVPNTTTCQLHMHAFKDGDTIYVEPFRATAFPIKCDLKVDRSAFDRITTPSPTTANILAGRWRRMICNGIFMTSGCNPRPR